MPAGRPVSGLRGASPDFGSPMHTAQPIASPPPGSVRRLGRVLVLAVTLAAALAATMTASANAGACDYVASSTGADSAPGTVATPFRTVQHLLRALKAGKTGCVRAGTYAENLTFSHGGAAGAPLTLTGYPGDIPATILGRMWLPSGSDNVTVSGLNLNGANSRGLPSPTVDDAHASFIANDVTNGQTTICFNLGDDTGRYGAAQDTLIQSNRVHDCGALPATNHDHGIYIEEASHTQILGNVIDHNADRGIQLYPNSQGALIKGNVIDANGEGVIFSGDFGQASSDNVVENNLITNSSVRNNVESWYPSGTSAGHGNLVTNNCIGGGARGGRSGGIDPSEGGFTATDNIVANPRYENANAGQYTLIAGSPCAGILAVAPGPRAARASTTQRSSQAISHHQLSLKARVSVHDFRLLVDGRLPPVLLTKPRAIVVLARVGRRWQVMCHRVVSRHASFHASLRLRRDQMHDTIHVRAKIVGAPYQSTIVVRAA